MTDIHNRMLTIDGRNVCCLTSGPESGQPILLLHGARFSSETWREIGVIDALTEKGYRVHAVDLPGYGRSEASESQPFDWLRSLLDELGAERPVVVSPSMSGRYALPLAIGDPGRVAGFVAVAPVGIHKSRDQIDRITCPVLAVWGENDGTIPIQLADLLVASVANGRKVVIPGGSHAPYMSDPTTFLQELLEFLGELN